MTWTTAPSAERSCTERSWERGSEASFLSRLAHHACAIPNAPALAVIDALGQPAQCVSYGRLAATVIARAAWLHQLIPVQSAVAVWLPSTPDYVLWLCAGLAAGLRVLPLHEQLTVSEVNGMCARIGAAAIITEDARRGGLERPYLSARACKDSLEVPSPLNSTILSTKGGGVLLPSSGTTGTPKVVWRDAAALDAMAYIGARVYSLEHSETVLAALPLCHSYGVDILLATLYAGACLQILPRFDAPSLAESLCSGRPTVFPGVPFMFEALSRISPPKRESLNLRLAISAGAPLSATVWHKVRSVWGIRVAQLYGASELGSVAIHHQNSDDFDPTCVGNPFPGTSIRVFKPEGTCSMCPTDVEGEVGIRSASMLSAYHPHHPLPVHDGHLLTGDLGRLDARGRLHITGRMRLLIDIGGLKVNPVEVESVLALHPAVQECVVVPLPLSDTVNRLRAVIIVRTHQQGVAPEALREFLRPHLASFKIPRVFEFVPMLPRTPSGKPDRAALAAAFSGKGPR